NALVGAGAAGLVALLMAGVYQHREARQRLATQEQALAAISEQIEATTREAEALVTTRALDSLRTRHPRVGDLLAAANGEPLRVSFLRSVTDTAADGHGA